MIQVDSLVAVFMVEGLVGAFVFVIGIAIFMIRRRTKDRKAAIRFIDSLKNAESNRSQNLEAHISEVCDLDEERVDAMVTEVKACEKSLYQKMIQLFLHRDSSALVEIDQSVQNLSQPFCKVLSVVSKGSKENPELAESLEAAQVEIERLKKESERLAKQLSTALETMDDISSEYSNLFNSSREAEELDMSRKRMLNTYMRAEEQMAEIFSGSQPVEEVSIEEI